jgi:hypothetical protein
VARQPAATVRSRTGTSTGRGKRRLALAHGLRRLTQRLAEIFGLQIS